MDSTLSATDLQLLITAEHSSPRSVLGYHEITPEPAAAGQPPRCVIRAFEPGAAAISMY